MPSISDFFWLNQQGQKAFDDTIDGYILFDGYGWGGDELNLLLQSIPHFPFTANAHIRSLTPVQDGYQKCRYGMVLRQTNGTPETGKDRLLSFSLELDGYAPDGYQRPALRVSKHESVQAVPGLDYITIFNDGYSATEFLQIQDNGTDLHFSFSNDGNTFTEIFMVDRRDFLLLGGNEVGFGGVGNLSVNNTAQFLLMDWTIT